MINIKAFTSKLNTSNKERCSYLLIFTSIISLYLYIDHLIIFAHTKKWPDIPTRIRFNLRNKSSCKSLNDSVIKTLGNEYDKWSLTVLNKYSNNLIDINGTSSRIPASNQKLFTTAFALDRLGPNHKLNTKITVKADNNVFIDGQGDPDFDVNDLNSLLNNAFKSVNSDNHVNYFIRESTRDNWWPITWSNYDKQYSYGAPITKIAFLSNSSLEYPFSLMNEVINSHNNRFLYSSSISFLNDNTINKKRNINTTFIKYSAPLYSLISLANSESHNYTAEILLRNSAGTWNQTKASLSLLSWMAKQNIPLSGIKIEDGSGLSRSNRLTSSSLAFLLHKMSRHRYKYYFESSLSIAGIRGTMKQSIKLNFKENKFYGKTGTLNGIRTLSGNLYTKSGVRHISIMSEYSEQPGEIINKILNIIASDHSCY